MSHHHRREQRNARVIAVIAFAILLAIFAPLIARPGLRLDLAESLGAVPDGPREELFPDAIRLELILLVEEFPVEFSLPLRRYTAVYVAERTPDAVLLHDLAVDRTVTLPLTGYDRIAAAADRSGILVVDESSSEAKAVYVDVASGEVRTLPPGEFDPGIPGNWNVDVADLAIDCGAISPSGEWVACVNSAPRLLGDWELEIHPTGRSRDREGILRGLGSTPVVGWAADESAVYLQNEKGVFKVPLDL